MSLQLPDLLALALASLRGNRTRTLLSVLGVFMGVAAVQATLQIRSLNQAKIAQQLAEREAPQVQAGVWTFGKTSDVEALRRRFPDAHSVSGLRGVAWDEPAVYRDREANLRLTAVTRDYFETTGRRILKGRPLIADDFQRYRNSVVIDTLLAAQLFGELNPLNQVFYLHGAPYTIVGVMEQKNAQWETDEPLGTAFMPLATQQALTGSDRLGSVAIRPRGLPSQAAMEALEAELEAAITELHPQYTQPEYSRYLYVGSNVAEIIEAKAIAETQSRALLGVGFIALTVAAVGIANITVAAVLERTKEIGLRRALGARQRDILCQFLLEATIISVAGGLAAAIAVDVTTWTLTQQEIFDLPPYQFQPGNVAISLTAAVTAGLASSLLPARRASQLDPVAALRSE